MPRDAPWIKETCLGDDEGGESPGDAADADAEACASLRLERTAVGALAREDVPTDDVETPPRQTGIRRAADAEACVLEDKRSIARASIARRCDRGGRRAVNGHAARLRARPRVTWLSAVSTNAFFAKKLSNGWF